MAVRAPIDWQRASWEEACAEVAQFTDNLGCEVDDGIFDTVVALNLLGLRTVQSCEGHLNYGHPYPWVWVADPEHNNRVLAPWKYVCALEDEAKALGTLEAHDAYIIAYNAFKIQSAQWKREDRIFQRVISLLNAFYVDREQRAARLMACRMRPGLCRIELGCGREIRELPETLQASYLTRGQAEMQAFTAFLKQQIEQKVSRL